MVAFAFALETHSWNESLRRCGGHGDIVEAGEEAVAEADVVSCYAGEGGFLRLGVRHGPGFEHVSIMFAASAYTSAAIVLAKSESWNLQPCTW
jgi:hypothetical protein